MTKVISTNVNTAQEYQNALEKVYLDPPLSFTTAQLIASTTVYPAATVVNTIGYDTSGDGGAAPWKQTGVTGETPNQSPLQLEAPFFNDGNGDQWGLIQNGPVSALALGPGATDAIQASSTFGTAASADVTTGLSGGSAGQVTTVGYAGIGSNALPYPLSDFNDVDTLQTGFYDGFASTNTAYAGSPAFEDTTNIYFTAAVIKSGGSRFELVVTETKKGYRWMQVYPNGNGSGLGWQLFFDSAKTGLLKETLGIENLNANILKSSAAHSTMLSRLPFNHEHSTHLKFQVRNTRPLTRAKSAALMHIDTGMSDLWFSTGPEMQDWAKLDKSIGRRRFLVLESQHYIALDAAYTGDVTIRVWPFQNGRSGLVDTTETQGLTMGSWQEITYSVTAMDELFRNDTGTVTYFYGLVDFVRTGHKFDLMDTNSSRLSAIEGNITNTSPWSYNPLMDFTLENDGFWYSDDLTLGVAESVDAGWTALGNNRYSCSGVTNGGVLVKALSNSESQGKTFELAVRVESLSGVLATTLSNVDEFRAYEEGTYRFIITNDDITLKRAFGSLTTTVQIISVRIRINK